MALWYFITHNSLKQYLFDSLVMYNCIVWNILSYQLLSDNTYCGLDKEFNSLWRRLFWNNEETIGWKVFYSMNFTWGMEFELINLTDYKTVWINHRPHHKQYESILNKTNDLVVNEDSFRCFHLRQNFLLSTMQNE